MAGTTDTQTLLVFSISDYNSSVGPTVIFTTTYTIHTIPFAGIYLKETKCECKDVHVSVINAFIQHLWTAYCVPGLV